MKFPLKTLIILCLSLSFVNAQIKKDVGEFTTLKAFDLINITLIESNKNSVEITGENANNVVIVNKNGTLKIRMNLEEIFDGDKTDVVLYHTGFEILDANEGAFIISKDRIAQRDIELKAQEGGYIKVDLDVKDADIRAYSGGTVETHGNVNRQVVKVNTGGIYKGEQLNSVTCKLGISAGGESHIRASELVDLKITAGGDAFIYGNPSTVNERKVIGGRVKRMD